MCIEFPPGLLKQKTAHVAFPVGMVNIPWTFAHYSAQTFVLVLYLSLL